MPPELAVMGPTSTGRSWMLRQLGILGTAGVEVGGHPEDDARLGVRVADCCNQARMTGIDQLDADEEERAITAELRAF